VFYDELWISITFLFMVCGIIKLRKNYETSF